MKNSEELFSYPIVVIESIWPKLPDEAPKLVGKKYNTKKPEDRTKSAFLYSDTQNAFSGYFKIIPLNIKSININNSKDGHSFDIAFDASYVYVQVNPKYVSQNVYNYIVRNSFKFTQTSSMQAQNEKNDSDAKAVGSTSSAVQDLNYLSGILEGFSKSQMEGNSFLNSPDDEHYFVPGTVVSKFINEMDTVTVFLVQDLGIFDQSELIKLAGGSFSRMREIEKLSGTQKLSDLGITKPSSTEDLTKVTLAKKLSSLRSFLSVNSIGKYAFTYAELTTPDAAELTLASTTPTPYIPNTNSALSTAPSSGQTIGVGRLSLLLASYQEEQNISNAITKLSSNLNISSELVAFGTFLNKYFSDILGKFSDNQGKIDYLKNKIIPEIQKYYAEDYLSNTISWALYKSLYELLEPLIAGTQDANVIRRIIKTAAIDLYIQQFYGNIYADILADLNDRNSLTLTPSTKDQSNAYFFVNKSLENLRNLFKAALDHRSYRDQANARREIFQNFSVEEYGVGLDLFFRYVVKPLVEEDNDVPGQTSVSMSEKASNISLLKDKDVEKNLQVLEDVTELKYPLSCETPYFILNGHVSKISDSSTVSGENYSRSITISGTGFELPLKSHTIYLDKFNANSKVFQNISKGMLSNATPIAAALSIMAIHMPDYPQYIDKNQNTTEYFKTIKDQRNFALFNEGLGYFVDKGTVLLKTPTVTNEYFILAPIHYVDKSYLKVIKNTFDTTLVATNQILTEQRSISDGSVYDNLRAFLSTSSMYSFFIDEFGTMKLRFEPSAVTQTNSTILSPPITDRTLMSLSLTSDQSQMFNLVEVLPKPLAALNKDTQSIVYSRATPPDIVDAYDLYKPLDLSGLLDNASDSFYSLLELLCNTFDDALTEIVKDYNRKRPSFNITLNSKNAKTSRPKLTDYDKTQDSVKKLVFETTFQTEEEKAAAAKAAAEKSDGTTSEILPVAAAEAVDVCVDSSTVTTTTAAAAASTASSPKAPENKTPDPVAPKPAYEFFFQRHYIEGITAPYKEVLYDGNFSTYPAEGNATIPFTLTPNNLKETATTEIKAGNTGYAELAKDLGKEFTYYSYIRYRIQKKLEATYLSNFSKGGVFYLGALSSESIDVLTDLLSTLFYLGAANNPTKENLKKYILPSNKIGNYKDGEQEKNVINYISWIVKSIRVFYVPSRVEDLKKNSNNKSNFTNNNFIIEEKESHRLPYAKYTIQDFEARTISADYFRYGLRRLQQDDYYSQTSTLTDFRAETLRKLYEYPMKTASISILLNPMYKVGNTVLVATEYSPNNKGTYINLGVKNMLATISSSSKFSGTETEGYNLFFRADDLIKNSPIKLNMEIYKKLSGNEDIAIDEKYIFQHFVDMAKFMMDTSINPKQYPVPSDAYVPLLGIYSGAQKGEILTAIKKYLSALVTFYAVPIDETTGVNYTDKYGANGYKVLYENIENAIIEVYKAVVGTKNFDLDMFNHINNLLKPQNYHVYQYHINAISHSWSFGRTSTTNLSGNFGLPALMTYIPTNSSYEFGQHIVGYMVTRGPNFYFNEYGGSNQKLTAKKDVTYSGTNFQNKNVAYLFSKEQLVQEETFYKSKYRYKLESILEKIRRKYLMPELYGDLLFVGTNQTAVTPKTKIEDVPTMSSSGKQDKPNIKLVATTTTTTPKQTSATTGAKQSFNLSLITFYSLEKRQTDSTPFIGACNIDVDNIKGTKIAISQDIRDRIGIKNYCKKTAKLVYKDDKGKTQSQDVVIWDVMNERYKNAVDILVYSGDKSDKAIEQDTMNAVGKYFSGTLYLY